MPADKQVDMGVFNIGGTNYRLIFTKSNLTATGLAASESAYGDYFAWGATKPWYTSYSGNRIDKTKLVAGKSGGYTTGNAPFYDYDTSSYTKYTTAGNTLEAADDAANKILGGNWQIPTLAIWQALEGISTKGWDSGYKFTNNGQTLFLPAAGYIKGTYFQKVGSYGYYWSGTAYSNYNAYNLYFKHGEVNAQKIHDRGYGCPVRPVRLVAVD